MATATLSKTECLNPNTGGKLQIDTNTYQLFSKAIYHVLKVKPGRTFADLVKGVKQSKNVIEILSTAFILLRGANISNENPYAWLTVFDLDDIQDFISELTKAFSLIDSTSVNAWDLIASIIYEWHESAIAISSPELANAFNDEIDEVLLTKPFLDNLA